MGPEGAQFSPASSTSTWPEPEDDIISGACWALTTFLAMFVWVRQRLLSVVALHSSRPEESFARAAKMRHAGGFRY